jgi:hypothetical protein
MFQCVLAFFNEVVPFSITSMTSSNASLVDLPLLIKRLHLSTSFYFLVDYCSQDGGTSSLSWLSSSYNPLRLLRGTLMIMI